MALAVAGTRVPRIKVAAFARIVPLIERRAEKCRAANMNELAERNVNQQRAHQKDVKPQTPGRPAARPDETTSQPDTNWRACTMSKPPMNRI